MANLNTNIASKLFTYISHGVDINDEMKEIYQNSLIFIGDEGQIYLPAFNAYFGTGNSQYAEVAGSSVWERGEGELSVQTKDTNAYARGVCSLASGNNSTALGGHSVAMGYNNIAEKDYSNAFGAETTAGAIGSHTEGCKTVTGGNYESNTIVSTDGVDPATGDPYPGAFAHAEGRATIASGAFAHSEGDKTLASGMTSHAEGNKTIANGNCSHAEGENSVSIGRNSHAEGWYTYAIGDSSHAEGTWDDETCQCGLQGPLNGKIFTFDDEWYYWHNGTILIFENPYTRKRKLVKIKSTNRDNNTVEFYETLDDESSQSLNGEWCLHETTIAIGDSSHAEGWVTQAIGDSSHTEGCRTLAYAQYSHAEGEYTLASGWSSHAEGNHSYAYGQNSHAEGGFTGAIGENSHAEGIWAYALGSASHAEGYKTITGGTYSSNTLKAAESWVFSQNGAIAHAEGDATIASGHAAHAEGIKTFASGSYSHAEGGFTEAIQTYTHAEGWHTKAQSAYAHAEGRQTTASNLQAHSEGNETEASGQSSHAEGWTSEAIGNNSHAEGEGTIAQTRNSHAEGEFSAATGQSAHAEGDTTLASGKNSHAEGELTEASALRSHAEGYQSKASGQASHAEGNNSNATKDNSHAEGQNTHAQGANSHAEGVGTTAIGSQSHAEGNQTIANANRSHAEGYRTYADGNPSHAEGSSTYAIGMGSHSEGWHTYAYGNDSHSEGVSSYAIGNISHAEGEWTYTYNSYEHAQGLYNVSHSEDSVFGNSLNSIHTVGIGTGNDDRKNAVTIMQNGDMYLYGVAEYDGTNPDSSKPLQQYFEETEYVISSALNDLHDNINSHELYITQNQLQGNANFAYLLNGISITNEGTSLEHTISYNVVGIPTKEYVDSLIEANDALRYCGTVTPADAVNGDITLEHFYNEDDDPEVIDVAHHGIPDTSRGAVYKVTSEGYVGDEYVKAGDMIISYLDNAQATTYVGWNVINENLHIITEDPTNAKNTEGNKVLTNVHITDDGRLSYTTYSLSVQVNRGISFNQGQVSTNGNATINQFDVLRNNDVINMGIPVITDVTLTQTDLMTELTYSYTYIYANRGHHSTVTPTNTVAGQTPAYICLGQTPTNVLTGVAISADGELSYSYTPIVVQDSEHSHQADQGTLSYGLNYIKGSTGDESGVITRVYLSSYVDPVTGVTHDNTLTYAYTSLSGGDGHGSLTDNGTKDFVKAWSQTAEGKFSAEFGAFTYDTTTENHYISDGTYNFITNVNLDHEGKLSYTRTEITLTDSYTYNSVQDITNTGRVFIKTGIYPENKNLRSYSYLYNEDVLGYTYVYKNNSGMYRSYDFTYASQYINGNLETLTINGQGNMTSGGPFTAKSTADVKGNTTLELQLFVYQGVTVNTLGGSFNAKRDVNLAQDIGDVTTYGVTYLGKARGANTASMTYVCGSTYVGGDISNDIYLVAKNIKLNADTSASKVEFTGLDRLWGTI